MEEVIVNSGLTNWGCKSVIKYFNDFRIIVAKNEDDVNQKFPKYNSSIKPTV